MRKIVTGVFIVIGIVSHVNGQQAAQFTQYMVNPYLMNPALSSVEDMVDIKAGHRAQWVGFNQTDNQGNASGPGIAPSTSYISAHTPIGKPHAVQHYVTESKSWFGVGGKLMYDQTGPSKWGSYMVSGTYNMGLIKPKGSGIYTKGGLRMSAGMFLGVQQYSLDWDQLHFADSEPLQSGKSGTEYSFKPDATLGAWFYNDFLFFGISMDHVFGNRLGLSVSDAVNKDNLNTYPTLARHTYLTGGINYKVTDQLTWSPSLLLKYTPNAPLAIDVNNKLTYEDSYWVGLTYRHLDALAIAVGAIITYNYEIAYSYDYTYTDIRALGRTNGTHEITIGYRIAPKPTSMNAEDHNWGHQGHFKKKKYK